MTPAFYDRLRAVAVASGRSISGIVEHVIAMELDARGADRDAPKYIIDRNVPDLDVHDHRGSPIVTMTVPRRIAELVGDGDPATRSARLEAAIVAALATAGG